MKIDLDLRQIMILLAILKNINPDKYETDIEDIIDKLEDLKDGL